jgi:methionine synthase I (cobalamin-dependent)
LSDGWESAERRYVDAGSDCLITNTFGGLLKPFGEFTESQVRNSFEEKAAALVEAGVIIIEL